jgi:hypothetical protein
MPNKPTWYQRVPEIVREVEQVPTSVLDRFSIERLFGVRRRQALRILASLGGYQLGRTYVVEKQELLRHLRLLLREGGVQREVRRKERIWNHLQTNAKHWRARHIEVLPASAVTEESLPPEIVLDRQRLTIVFQEPTDLLQKLHSLVTMLADDYEGFERRWFHTFEESRRRAN